MVSFFLYAVQLSDGRRLSAFQVEAYGVHQTMVYADYTEDHSRALLMVKVEAEKVCSVIGFEGHQLVRVGVLFVAA